MEYDIVVKPGADPNVVKFQYAGIKGLEVTPAGDLAIKLPGGETLVQKKPVVYQEIAGTRVAREGKFRLHGDVAGHTYGFEVAAYDKNAPLVIDPILIYSSSFGGSYEQIGNAIRVDDKGCAYVAGQTASADFPTVVPMKTGYIGPDYYYSYFVCKFNTGGNALVYSTYLRGNHNYGYSTIPPTPIPPNDQWGLGMVQTEHLGLAVDAAGCAYITGPTRSIDWPLQNPAYAFLDKNGSFAGFVTKLAAGGNALIYSTYMRGSFNCDDKPRDIALGENGTVYMAGSTGSGALNETNLPGGWTNVTGFVTKLNASGNQFLWTKGVAKSGGAAGDTEVYRIVAEPFNAAYPFSGGVWLTGYTRDGNFPLVNALQSNMGASIYHTAFLAWVDSGVGTTPGTIRFSTFWGGTTKDDWTDGYGIARGGNGDLFVCGSYIWGAPDPTKDTRWVQPSPNAWKRYLGLDENKNFTAWNAFLFRVTNRWTYNSATNVWSYQAPQLVYSTYFGGGYQDSAYAVAADRYGNAYLTGDTFSNDFPLKNPLFTTPGNNIYISKIRGNGPQEKMSLIYSTYLGESCGGPNAGGISIALDWKNIPYVTGGTGADFPLVHPVPSPGSGVMVFKLGGGVALPWLDLLN